MKKTRYIAKMIIGEEMRSFDVYSAKDSGLLIEMDGSYVPVNTAKDIYGACILKKKKQRIRDNSFLDWARSILMAVLTVVVIAAPSAIIAVI